MEDVLQVSSTDFYTVNRKLLDFTKLYDLGGKC
jgi:hypothetical protein